MRQFQTSKGLNPDGQAGQNTRRALVLSYMQIPDTTLPPGTVLKTHGCGEFHLAVQTADNVDEPRNRRVEIYFFENRIDPPPRARCPSPGCPEYPIWFARTVQIFDLEHSPGTLEVTVRDPQGQVVGSAAVHASGATAADGITDASGRVRFPDLIPGAYTVLGHRDGFVDGTAQVQVGESPTTTPAPASTVVQLQSATGDLSVTVRDAGGNAIAGAQVQVQGPTGGSGSTGTTSASGEVSFPALTAGSYTVGASAAGFSGNSTTAQVLPNQTNLAPVTLQRATGDLTVTVVDNLGGALPGAQASVTPAIGAAPVPQSTNAQGRVTFTGLGVGGAQITVNLQGFSAGSGSANIVASTNASATITLTATNADLDVRVTNSVGGANLAGAAVALTGPISSLSATTGTNGIAHFSQIPAGNYTATVTLQDFSAGTGTLRVRINQSNLLPVALTPSVGNLEVQVQDNLSAAVSGAEVTLLPAPLSPPATPATDVQGRIGFTRVPVGLVDITVRKSGFQDGPAKATITPAGSLIAKVVLQPVAVDVTVHVVSSAGGDLVGAAVAVTGPASLSGATIAGGIATFHLPPGTYQFAASLDNFTAPAPATRIVATNQTNAVPITLTPNAVTALITPLPLVVVRPKHNCTPARVRVNLGVSAAFTGSGTGRFTCSTGAVRFFTVASGGTAIAFNGTDNVFTAARLAAGVPLFAEGGTVSTVQEDTDLRLELFVLTNAFGTPAAGKATCIELTVDLFQSRASRADPAVMAADAKTDRGRFVHLQDPGFHQGRAWLVVREVRPAAFTQNLELKVVAPVPAGAATGAVQLFPAELHAAAEAEVALPHAIAPAELAAAPLVAGSRGLVFFVEGRTTSLALRDVQLQLGIPGGQADGDRAAFTVVRFTKLKATIPSTQALMNRTANGLANTPVQSSVVTHAAGAVIAAADFDESYAANPPIAMIENSLAAATPVQLEVTVQPADTPVSWRPLRDTRPAGASERGGDANDVINPVPAPAQARPTVTAIASTSTISRATLLPDSVGSFRVRAFVDENGTGEFERDAATADSFAPEPFILMNFLLVRVIGVNNLSRPNNGANLVLHSAAAGGGPPTGDADVVSSTGDMLTGGPGAGFWARAVVNVIGGGSDGKRGLDSVFGAWIQNIVPTPGSPAPGGNTMDWGADYQVSVPHDGGPPTVQNHHQFILTTQEGGAGGAFLPPPNPPPHYTPTPILDVSNFPNAGMGGVLPAGAGAPGPNALAKVAIPSGGPVPSGEQWTVEFWDPPGVTFPSRHPAFPTAQMTAYRFNVDFKIDLCFWTNNQPAARALAPPAGWNPPGVALAPGWPTVAGAIVAINGPGVVPDPACCLYASVYSNTWNVRLSLRFALAAPFASTVVTPFAVSVTPEMVSRIARPVANLEVRFPTVHVFICFDATT